jgi:hypothetical protein
MKYIEHSKGKAMNSLQKSKILLLSLASAFSPLWATHARNVSYYKLAADCPSSLTSDEQKTHALNVPYVPYYKLAADCPSSLTSDEQKIDLPLTEEHKNDILHIVFPEKNINRKAQELLLPEGSYITITNKSNDYYILLRNDQVSINMKKPPRNDIIFFASDDQFREIVSLIFRLSEHGSPEQEKNSRSFMMMVMRTGGDLMDRTCLAARDGVRCLFNLPRNHFFTFATALIAFIFRELCIRFIPEIIALYKQLGIAKIDADLVLKSLQIIDDNDLERYKLDMLSKRTYRERAFETAAEIAKKSAETVTNGAVTYFWGLPAGIAAAVSGWFGGKK